MPRILPRLLKSIAHQKDTWSPLPPPRQKRVSLHKPVPPRPSFNPKDYSRSILLDPPETNPITSSHIYVQHKTLPPRLQAPKRAREKLGEYDRPRAMSEEERGWWSSPYLRMLGSPLRKCIVTNRYLPSDFLIRAAPMRIPQPNNPGSRSIQTSLIPDGLQHSQFTARRSGRAAYFICNKDAISMLVERNAHKRLAPNISVHALLSEQISHLLRLRALQELELLGDRMDSLLGQPNTNSTTRVIRRLTREELSTIRTTGSIPCPNAMAVMIVPPLNKNPVTKQRTKESMLSSPPVPESNVPSTKESLPLSTLHPTTIPESKPFFVDDPLPQALIPIYNGVSMFPARPQRAALHTLLSRLLDIERRTRRHSMDSAIQPDISNKDNRASHAFLLCSDADTSLRGDIAAVGIALWRVRMFEGSDA